MKMAMDFALERLGEKREEQKRKSALTLAEFASKFYTWNECPHVTRLRSEGM